MELLEDLLASHYLLYLIVLFGFLASTEDVLDCLQLLIDDQELAFVLCRSSALVDNRNVPFDQIEFLKAEERHVEAKVRSHFVDLVGVTRRDTAEDREPVGVARQVEVYLEVWDALQHLEDCPLVLLEELLLDLVVGLNQDLQDLLVLHGRCHFTGVH